MDTPIPILDLVTYLRAKAVRLREMSEQYDDSRAAEKFKELAFEFEKKASEALIELPQLIDDQVARLWLQRRSLLTKNQNN
jgi:hypothetical protein